MANAEIKHQCLQLALYLMTYFLNFTAMMAKPFGIIQFNLQRLGKQLFKNVLKSQVIVENNVLWKFSKKLNNLVVEKYKIDLSLTQRLVTLQGVVKKFTK